MSEHENELKKALAENGNFDVEKAERMAVEATSGFDSRLRRNARIAWFRFIVAIAVFEVAFVGICFSFSTKSVVVFAVLVAISVLLMAAFDIQHRIINAKVSLLREIKLVRLEHLGLPTNQPILSAYETTPTGTSRWSNLSLRENVAWFLALILVAAASCCFTSCLMAWGAGATLINESHVTLSPDGAGIDVFKVSYPYFGWFPLNSSSMWTGEGEYAITRWLDDHGRELPMSVANIGGNRRYSVELVEPVMPGSRFEETLTLESAKMAKKEGDVWTYHGDPMYGHEKNFYLTTIQLPKGAEIVSVDPKPAQQSVVDGLPTVRFQATRACNEKFSHTIKYRLPDENTPQAVQK